MMVVAALLVALLPPAMAIAHEASRSSIQMNQVGFELHGPKTVSIIDPSPSPLSWRVLDVGGAMVVEGSTEVHAADATSGQTVHTADLRALTTPGANFRLVVGRHTSRPFRVGERPFSDLKRDTLTFFHQQRSGVPIEAVHVQRPDLARPAGHAPDRATCFAGSDTRGRVWTGCDYVLDVSGGWYDAGDHGKYVVNAGVSVWTLLNAHERAMAQGRSLYADGSANIPEAGNGVDDLLDEVRWEIEFMLRMQLADDVRLRVPVGTVAAGDESAFAEIDAGGMAHHKVHDGRWTGLPLRPDQDEETRYLYAPSTAATLNLAAVAAQCARVWRQIDPAFASTCQTAAERAWAAAIRHPQVFAVGSFEGGGDYGDDDLSDEFFWAAAELFASTGEIQYRQVLDRSSLLRASSDAKSVISWSELATAGLITLATTPALRSEPVALIAHDRLIALAEGYDLEGRRQPYGAPYAGAQYEWGSNSALLNRAVVLGVAFDLTRNPAFRDRVVHTLDYMLGRNPLDQSYVSGYGARPMRHPHHRFWAAGIDPAWPEPPPGALSGGPNNVNMSDPVAETMAGCAPQTCWRDDARSFTQNEVAINWNAPLVWVAAFLD